MVLRRKNNWLCEWRMEKWLQFLQSGNRTIQIRAARMLMESADELPLPVLLKILDEFHSGLEDKLRPLLKKRRDENLCEEMIRRINSPNIFVREIACRVLGNLGDFAATPYLITSLDDPDQSVRDAAALALGQIADPGSKQEVLKRYEQSRYDDIAERLEMALRRLGVRLDGQPLPKITALREMPYEDFGKLRFLDFFPITEDYVEDHDGGMECGIGLACTEGYAGRPIGFASPIGSNMQTAEMDLTFGDECPVAECHALLDQLGLKLRNGMTSQQIKEILGIPENSGWLRFVVGDRWPYYVGCHIDAKNQLTGVWICRKDLADKNSEIEGG